MNHIFISYAHEDYDFANSLRLELEKSGFSAWLDSHQIKAGSEYRKSIAEGIGDALILILIISESSKNSEFVTYEWAYAMGLGKTVLPIILRPTQLHAMLEPLQYLDYTSQRDNFFRVIARVQEIYTELQVSPQSATAYESHLVDLSPAALYQAILRLYETGAKEVKAADIIYALTRSKLLKPGQSETLLMKDRELYFNEPHD
jgi:hypothetical protein